MRTMWTFHNPGQLLFGRGAVGQLGEVVGQMGARRVLIVTDKTLADAGLVEQVCNPLAGSDISVEVFDGGEPEPPIHAVNDAIDMARDTKTDLLLGLGGGSNMDIAKAAAVVLAHGGAVKDYAGDQVVPGPIFPLILIPTTAGTGSEVTAASVLNDTEAGSKFGILSNHLRPKVAIVDPMLTVSCPPKVTAASGIDALTHAVEAYTAIDNEAFPLPDGERTVYQGRHPLADVLAERAIELVGRHLRRAVDDGSDLEAREGMALAAMLAGMAFSNVGVAVVHALEYALNQTAHTPHGLGCGLLLPYVMRFNASARPSQMSRIAELLGEEVAGLDAETAAERAVTAVERLKLDIGIPADMSEVGVSAEQIPDMAKAAFGVKRILRVNPRSVTQEDLESILQSALSGSQSFYDTQNDHAGANDAYLAHPVGRRCLRRNVVEREIC
jgi:alcohol dehydrogenase class IV